VTVGTGVGGGFVLDGRVHGQDRPAAAEIGHLRPGLHAERPDIKVESLASGWGIAAAAKSRISGDVTLPLLRPADRLLQVPGSSRRSLAERGELDQEFKRDLLLRANGDLDRLTAHRVAQAAAEGNQLALDVIGHATEVLGWAVAQMITLLAPEVVVVGGGVSLIGESLFLAPLREAAARYVFPPLADAYQIVAADLGELAVVHGAIALAAGSGSDRNGP
jgi:glucokinase